MSEERSNYSALAQLLNAIITRRDINIIEQFGMSEEHIHDPFFNDIYRQLKSHHAKYGEVPTPETLLSIGGSCAEYIQTLYQPESEASDEFLRDKVWEDHIYHEAARVLQSSADYVNTDPIAGIEYLKAAISHVTSQIGTQGTDIVHDPEARLHVYKDKQANSSWFYPTGFAQLDEKIGGFSPGEDLIVLFARTGVGKEQPLYSKVLTPSGWKRMGDIKLRDTVITATGDAAPVIGVFPQGVKEVYRVVFADGSFADAGIDHLWKVTRRGLHNDTEVVSTRDLMKNPHKYKIACVPELEFDSQVKLNEPYKLGMSITSGSILATEYEANTYYVNGLDIPATSALGEDITKLTLNNTSVSETDYKTRKALLAGICDSIATYDSFRRCVKFSFTSALCNKITCDLVRSLGGSIERSRKSRNVVYAYLPSNPFYSSSHGVKWKPCSKRRLFKRVRCVLDLNIKEQCQCIMVDHPDHTYITDSYTATHNTWIMTKMLHESWKNGYNVGLIEPEMTGVKIGYRFDTINQGYSNKDLVYGRDLSSGPSDYAKYIEELPNQSSCKFMVGHPKDFNGSVTVSKLKSWCLLNDIKILGIDGISYMKDERGKPSDSTTMALTNISADLMELSIELGIPVLVVVQSNREGTAQGGKLALENIRDSDGISHSASKVLGLYKKNDALHIQLLKNRDGDNDVTLAYDWDINVGKFQFLQEGEVEGDNPDSGSNSQHSYTPQSNSSSSQRPERMSATYAYESVNADATPTSVF